MHEAEKFNEIIHIPGVEYVRAVARESGSARLIGSVESVVAALATEGKRRDEACTKFVRKLGLLNLMWAAVAVYFYVAPRVGLGWANAVGSVTVAISVIALLGWYKQATTGADAPLAAPLDHAISEAQAAAAEANRPEIGTMMALTQSGILPWRSPRRLITKVGISQLYYLVAGVCMYQIGAGHPFMQA